MKNILKLSLLFICLIVMVGCGKKDDNKLVMVTEAGFAPYEYYENGEIVGVVGITGSRPVVIQIYPQSDRRSSHDRVQSW